MNSYNYQDALLAFRSGDLRKCRIICDYLIKDNVKNVEAIYLLAQVEINQNNNEKAVFLLKEVIEKSPDTAQYHFALGKVYLHINQRQEALNHFRVVVSIDSNIAEAWSLMCSILGQYGLLEEAIKTGKTAVRLQPEFLVRR